MNKRAALCTPPVFLLTGCGDSILSPAGPVAASERVILLDSLAIMLVIVVPTIVATLGFAWWFRAGNRRANYLPTWAYSGQLELIIWSIPALVVLFLGSIAWLGAHELDPAKPLDIKAPPLEIEVVSLDWKWLFIYPQQNVASINFLAIPSGVPVHFRLTSASVMNVFFVPRLGSQIYAMNGMVTELNLAATTPGIYHGLSAHFSGDGFADMAFDVEAMPQDRFDSWITAQQAQPQTLDETEYRRLLRQSTVTKPYAYHAVQPGLFDDSVMQKLPPGDGPVMGQPQPAVSPRSGATDVR